MSWIVRDVSRDPTKEWEVGDEGEAKDKKATAVELGANPEDIEIIPPTQDVEPDVVDQTEEAKADGGSTESVPSADSQSIPASVDSDEPPAQPTPEEMEADPDIITSPEDLEQDVEAIDQLGEELDTDPLSILPDHMTDDIKGTPAVNKRGYAMIAERYGIEVSAEIEQYPWENDEGRCVAHATAVTEDGREYSGWGTACADDGDMADNIIEIAETRSLKRAVSWSSGVGIVSYQEMSKQLEEKYQ